MSRFFLAGGSIFDSFCSVVIGEEGEAGTGVTSIRGPGLIGVSVMFTCPAWVFMVGSI